MFRNKINRTERSLCKDSVRPSQRTQFYSIRKKNGGILGKETLVLCQGYRTVHILCTVQVEYKYISVNLAVYTQATMRQLLIRKP